MRTFDPSELLTGSHCAAGAFLPHKCSKKWEQWCKACNLVFCVGHADPTFHACKPRDEPIFPGLVRRRRTNSKSKSGSKSNSAAAEEVG